MEDHGRKFGHFIGGQWVHPEGRKAYNTKNPATGKKPCYDTTGDNTGLGDNITLQANTSISELDG